MKTRKDILFLCQYFYPEYVSSATLPYDTAEALKLAGFSVGVMCGYPKEYSNVENVPPTEVHNGIEIKRLKYLQSERNNILGRLINYFSFTLAVVLRFGYFRNYRSIIVYSNPPVLPLVAAWASRVFGSKLIFVSYDVYPEIAYITNSISEHSLISVFMSIVNKRVCKYVTKVVALSNDMKSYLLKHRPQLTEQQLQVIPNWYENNQGTSPLISCDNELFKDINPKGKFIVSYFGNMGICQDLDTILNAIRNLKNDSKTKFVFAGHGSKMELLKKVVKEEKLENVVVYDFLHEQDFLDALNISDCCLVSLLDGLTGLAVPSKTYCYMMAGKPVIAIMGEESDISKDIIDNKAGFVIRVGDVFGLVTAIGELKTNDTKREYMGQNSRKVFFDKYTKAKCTQQYVDMMSDILED